MIRSVRKSKRANVPVTIFLVGFSGSGKSTVGPKLARRLKTRFYDTDSLIENHCGKSITNIFKEDGEAVFRQFEKNMIKKIIEQRSPSRVIALGGGAYQNSNYRKLIKKAGLVVYLSCSEREIYRRMRTKQDRPLLKKTTKGNISNRQSVMNKIKKLLHKRRSTYLDSDIRVSTTRRNVEQTVIELYRKINRFYAGS